MSIVPSTASVKTGRRSSVALLVSGVSGAVILTLIAGILLYINTRRLIVAGEWVDHTEEVLLAVQGASRLTDGIEANAQLSLRYGSDEKLAEARTSAVKLSIAVAHLKALVADNPFESPNIAALTLSTTQISQALEMIGLAAEQPTPQGTPTPGLVSNKQAALQLKRATLECEERLGLMSEQERRLLKERNDTASRSSSASYATEIIFVALSLLSLLGLFTFFLRDAFRHKQITGQMAIANETLAGSVAALEDQAHEARLLTFARNELQLCLKLSEVYDSAARSFSLLLPGSSGALCVINNSRNLIETAGAWGDTRFEDLHPPQSCCGLRSGHPRWRMREVSEIHCSHFPRDVGPECYLCVPIAAHGETQGMLYVECAQDSARIMVERRMDGLRQLLQLTGMTVASLNLRIKLENQSIRDPLTNLFNRHFMHIALERELARAERRKSMLAVLMIDVDHFKNFNDTWGHACGDTVLKAVAAVYQSAVRAEDIVCRYGGEEFMIILSDITPDDAWARAEGIRRAVSALRVPLSKQTVGEVTVSIGLSIYPTDGLDVDTLLPKADKALYRAKQQGRNRVLRADLFTPVEDLAPMQS